MIRKSGREDELVHPPVFAFAAWHQMRQHQTEQQTDAQHTAAVHKPLHDNGALFIISCRFAAFTFCATTSSFFNFGSHLAARKTTDDQANGIELR